MNFGNFDRILHEFLIPIGFQLPLGELCTLLEVVTAKFLCLRLYFVMIEDCGVLFCCSLLLLVKYIHYAASFCELGFNLLKEGEKRSRITS